jgi:hypothetical protein
MNDIDMALVAAIKAAATAEPKPKKITKSCQLVAFVSDTDVMHASADRSQLVKFCDYINTVAAIA